MSRFVAIMTLLAVAICQNASGQAQNSLPASQPAKLPYRIVDTGQRAIFSDKEQLLQVPKRGEPFFGQDGFYRSAPRAIATTKTARSPT